MIYTFPTLSQDQDSKLFSQTVIDSTVATSIEGGYFVTRARHTRRPRRKIETGFTNISEADRLLLEEFINTVKVAALMFYWNHPVTGEQMTVRLKSAPDFSYAGMGGNHRWNVSMSLEEA